MTTIVKGHGERIDSETTFVPEGTILKFDSGFDVDLNSIVSLVALLNGAVAPPVETVVGRREVHNYTVYTQDDEYLARWLALGGKSGVPIKWVGTDIPDQTRLCAAPGICDELGLHACNGVLGRVKDTEIVILACRGVEGQVALMEHRYGTDASHPLHEVVSDLKNYENELYKLRGPIQLALSHRQTSCPKPRGPISQQLHLPLLATSPVPQESGRDG